MNHMVYISTIRFNKCGLSEINLIFVIGATADVAVYGTLAVYHMPIEESTDQTIHRCSEPYTSH